MNTVFIIGAGASKEANLPTGNELKGKIAQLLNIRFSHTERQTGDNLIFQALRQFAQNDGTGDINPYLNEAWHIRDALHLAISIDNFIDAHKDNEKIALCGKLAIVRSILDAEKSSLLYFDRSRNQSNIAFVNLEDTWYLPFFRLLTENCRKNDLKERLKSVALIIFNYDRCVEHFIYYSLQKYYKISETESAEIVKSINIYHPYGNVGTLPWISPNSAMEFGMEPNPAKLLELIQKIKTFTEGTDIGSSEISEIRQHLATADRVVFMGFAFHKLNMQLIYPHPLDVGKRIKCYATAFELSEIDQEEIKAQIKEVYRQSIDIQMTKTNVKCGQFFKEVWRSLAF
jgi:hypothetical protein